MTSTCSSAGASTRRADEDEAEDEDDVLVDAGVIVIVGALVIALEHVLATSCS